MKTVYHAFLIVDGERIMILPKKTKIKRLTFNTIEAAAKGLERKAKKFKTAKVIRGIVQHRETPVFHIAL